MIEKWNAWWRRAGQVVALVGMAALGLLDLYSGGILIDGTGGGSLVGRSPIAFAVATAAVWLPAHRQGSRRLAVAAALVAVWSLGVTTVLYRSVGDGLWGLAESTGLLGTVFVLARRAAPRPGVAAIAATGLAVAAQPLRVSGSDTLVIIGMCYALLAAGAATAGMYLRLVAPSRERQLAAVRAEQRSEFARDLHDFIAHHVTGIVVQAQGARFVAEQDPQRVLTALDQIERAGLETMTAMRRMVGVLRGQGVAPEAPLVPLAGVGDLSELVDTFAAAGAPPAHLHTDGRLDDQPVDVTSSAYGVVMEALTNVRQHAGGARRVDVWVVRTSDWLLVRVTDDGPGPRGGLSRDRQGFGLAGMTERVGAIGGRLRAGPGIAGGWVVDAALPLDRERAR